MAIKRLNAVFEKFRHLLPDTWELLTGKRDTLTPPRWMNFVGDGDFKVIGQEFFRYFVELGGLQPRDKVLEVGCGIGRMAVPLMDYLKDGGIYEGFDIVEHGIRWCKKKITPRAPHFQFHLADIYNHGYNPTGKHRAAYYRFPYEDETFDFVFLTSVFTHMLPRDMEHYLSEISRVLKSGGRCLVTFFLLNDDSNRHIQSGDSAIDFKHRMDGHPQNLIKDLFVPEAAVAYPEHYIKELYENNCLRITQSVCYGSWCGRQEFLSFQDIVVAMKNELKNVLSNE
jgi:ubiquinone/menaquinone biosynthesis C-methylase UbiE